MIMEPSLSEDPVDPEAPAISKNARKRMLKAEKWEATKKAKRQQLKARKKLRRENEKALQNATDLANGKPAHVSTPITEEELAEIQRKRKESKVNRRGNIWKKVRIPSL